MLLAGSAEGRRVWCLSPACQMASLLQSQHFKKQELVQRAQLQYIDGLHSMDHASQAGQLAEKQSPVSARVAGHIDHQDVDARC